MAVKRKAKKNSRKKLKAKKKSPFSRKTRRKSLPSGTKKISVKKFRNVLRKKKFSPGEIANELSVAQSLALLTFISPLTLEKLKLQYKTSEQKLKQAARIKARKLLKRK